MDYRNDPRWTDDVTSPFYIGPKARVAERVAGIVASARASGLPMTQKEDVLAARHLFSTLSALERIAVLAAERGDGIPGQLEDEHVHRDGFAALAEMHGGLEEAPLPAQKLIDYLSDLEGEASLAALNVVAESWLETVFHHLGKAGVCDEVFKIVEDDEHRHAHDALALARPDPDEIEPVVRDLEKMLMEISMSGEFMLPMAWFLGPTGVANMGSDIAKSHARACEHLGVAPALRDLAMSCKIARILDRTKPTEVEMNEWERLKLETWHTVAPQYCVVDVETNTANLFKLQAQLVVAAGRVLARYPRLRNVVRRKQLYRTDHPCVGVRELYDPDRVITLFVSRPEKYSVRHVSKMLIKQKRRFLDEPYEPYRGPISTCAKLVDLMPPNRCSLVISCNASFGGLFGVGPLSEYEGVPASVTIGEVQMKPFMADPFDDPFSGQRVRYNDTVKWRQVVTLTVQLDHRVGDGKEIGWLASQLREELPRVQGITEPATSLVARPGR